MERYTYDHATKTMVPMPDEPQQIHCEKCHHTVFRNLRHQQAGWFQKEHLEVACARCRAHLEWPCGIVRFVKIVSADEDTWNPCYYAFWLD